MTRILFLAANPKDTPPQRLDEDIRTIEERIRLADLRNLFEVIHEPALRTTDLHYAFCGTNPKLFTLPDWVQPTVSCSHHELGQNKYKGFQL
jgi:hypothetical protein